MSELIARTVKDFCRAYGLGQTTAWKLIKTGKLEAVKVGARTLILEKSAKLWMEGLPRKVFSPPKDKAIGKNKIQQL